MNTIPEPETKELRKFGLVTGVILSVLFGLIFPWLAHANIPYWPWIAGGILVLWALIAPDTLRYLYQWWMRLGLLLGRFTTPFILGVVFFFVVTPMALIMKLLRQDPMLRKFDSQLKSYRLPSHKPAHTNMEKPY